MNRIDQLFQTRKRNILSIYFTAGYPHNSSIMKLLQLLQDNGANMVEIGLPFSDPLADGPVIQESSRLALLNGMSIEKAFQETENMRQSIKMPVVMMGYLNPVLRFGVENFLARAAGNGVDGIILPDLPPEIYTAQYQALFERYQIYPIFLVTPQSTDDRIRLIDSISKGFVYAVSSSSTTGSGQHFGDSHLRYFGRLQSLRLKNPVMIGFGINDSGKLTTVFAHASGGIVGSAFIRSLEENLPDYGIEKFMKQLNVSNI